MFKDCCRIPMLAVAAFFVLATSAFTQSRPPATVTTPDGPVLIPVTTGVLGTQDPAAVAELEAHVAALGSAPWVGMQATGQMTYDSASSQTYAATLSNLGSSRFRLDVEDETGMSSVRIMRLAGKLQSANGTLATLPIDAALAGLFPFEMPRSRRLLEHAASLTDHGMTLVGTSTLRRITLEVRSIGIDPVTKASHTMATDFYFDPHTHLLIKSTALVPASGSRNVRFLLVTTYSDYRPVGTTLVPFRFVQTMEGQPLQTLQLTNVTLAPTLTPAYFQF